jgi:hypothetical protein
MTRAEFALAMRSLARAWAEKDYPRAAAFFSPDVEYADPQRYQLHGREELRCFFSDDQGFEQRTDLHTVLFDEEQQIGAVEYSYQGTHRYHGVALIKVEGDRFARWREYQHVSALSFDEVAGPTRF